MAFRWKSVGAVAAMALAVTACSSSSHSSSSSTTTGSGNGSGGSNTTVAASGTPYTIGFITSLTGGASSSYSKSGWGIDARVDAINAAGGVNGHPIKILRFDDASTPSGNLTAAQRLATTKNLLGVVDDTSFAFGGYQVLKAANLPVTGAAIDGPEWGTSYNMFSVIPATQAPIDGRSYTYTTLINDFKYIGITKLAQVGYQIASVTQVANQTFTLAAQQNISKCYLNDTISFGANDFTAEALAIKSAGCDGTYLPMLLTSVISIAQDLKNVGSTSKVLAATTAYSQDVEDSATSLASLAGNYTTAEVDLTNPNAAAQGMLDNLKKYTPYKGGIVDLNVVFAYLGTDLLLKGIGMAAPTPSPSKIISSLRTVSSYDGEGILPSATRFTGFGTPAMFPPTSCGPIFQITKTGFVPGNGGKPICGDLTSTPAPKS
jgi:branched-chain amino acid transport system substrate-binding protein